MRNAKIYFTGGISGLDANVFKDTEVTSVYPDFHENFIFANSVKRHICDTKISLQGHDLSRISKRLSDFAVSFSFIDAFVRCALRVYSTAHLFSLPCLLKF